MVLKAFRKGLDEVGLSSIFEDLDGDLTTAVVSAAYGYLRESKYSKLNAAVMAVVGYKFPTLAATAIAADTLLVQSDETRQFAAERFRDALDRRAKYVKAHGL
jgi:hypothetical protein